MAARSTLAWTLAAVLTLVAAGCNSQPAEESQPLADAGHASEESAAEPDTLLEPFDPPPLAELDARSEWVDQPVRDSLEMLRQKLAEEEPLATVEEVLALKNESAADNEKILSALGRLPEKDADVDWNARTVRHLGADLKSTNPLMISSTAEFYVSGLIGFGLFGSDWNMEPFGAKDAVVSWQTSKDRMYDKVVMRDDLVWSDGKPITAHDVVFSFQTIMNPKVPVPAVRPGTDQLRWVEAYDDYTIVFFHKEALATNLWNIMFPVVPKHIYEKSIREDPTLQDSAYHVEYENHPVSGGAYHMTQRVRGQEIVLTRREDYYMHQEKQVRDKPYFKEVRFRIIEDSNTSLLALKAGRIEESAVTPEQWMTQTGGPDFYERNTKATGLEWVYFYFGWNIKTPFFSDVRVRKAMSYAFDHEEMLQTHFLDLYEPANGGAHHTAWYAPVDPPPPYQRDLPQAGKLLDQAGWDDSDGDGFRDKLVDGRLQRFEFTILCAQDPTRIALCVLLQESLDRIGIICHVRPMEFTVLQERSRTHNFQAMLAGWGTGADPDSGINIWATKADRNFVQYSNLEVDKLFQEGRREFDREKRADIYRRIQTILYEEQPYTWLYFRNSFYGFNKKLRGYRFSPRGPYNYSPGFGSIWAPEH